MRFTPYPPQKPLDVNNPKFGGETQHVHSKFSYLLIVFDSVSVVFAENGYKRLRFFGMMLL